ncbi:hypothetical protein [Dactylosporangium sp. NPDC005555]|uniref:hypothetical protein n=1 Tax=Dactylosporangium sp. NPDC005555 TaxID=3154889 RepID=UPI0033A87486
MSAGAKAMQILFLIAGTLSIAFGTLGTMAESDDKKYSEWTCYAPTQPSSPQQCRGNMTGGNLQVGTNFILAGIGLEIAAAAVAFGGRRDQLPPPPMPYAIPGQPPFPPRPVPTGSPIVPAQAPPPPAWPAA